MIDAATQVRIRPLSSEGMISARVAHTEHVRVEFLRCRTDATVEWNVARPEVSLMWVRDRGSNARITVSGGESDSISPGRENFWFFPEGSDAHGELTGNGAYDCAGVFIDPEFLPPVVKEALDKPIPRFSHDALGRAFDELAKELRGQDEVLPLFTDGWAMQAMAYVARAAQGPAPRRASAGSGLAPWQLRKATGLFRTDLSVNLPLRHVADACKLSVSHFARAFKASTGVPPHQWLTRMRLEKAQELLAGSPTPLVDVAGLCGFADQSHFSRVFARAIGTSPGAWRRAQRA